jgi:hypothetical protein
VGSEISAGPIIRGGEIGGGFSQRIVTGGKLGLSRRIGEQDRLTSEHTAEAQRYRVLNAIRSLYYQALADQRLVQVRAQLARLAQDVVRISSELGNVGQADKPDMLSAEIEAQRLELGLTTARNALERTWRQIGAVVNDPALPPTLLEGDLENVPKLDPDQALEKIFSESPELRIAEVETTRSEMALKRAFDTTASYWNSRRGARRGARWESKDTSTSVFRFRSSIAIRARCRLRGRKPSVRVSKSIAPSSRCACGWLQCIAIIRTPWRRSSGIGHI